ncbi:MAG: uroporphyrinogen-III synthase [Pseudoxanthomonas sp.]
MAFTEPPGWYVISLRPQGEHASLRRAATAKGARLIALSPWKLRLHADDATRTALHAALDAPRVLFTSPAAVRAAAALLEFHPRADQVWIAVGSGTARALRRSGADRVQSPARMDSEGLLELPALQRLAGTDVGLVTAPEGRGLLASALRGRGARLLRADVYVREPIALSPAALRRLRALQAPAALALTSEGALRHVLAQMPADLVARLRAVPAIAASERLQRIARESGFAEVELAEGPRPRQLLAAMARRFR